MQKRFGIIRRWNLYLQPLGVFSSCSAPIHTLRSQRSMPNFLFEFPSHLLVVAVHAKTFTET